MVGEAVDHMHIAGVFKNGWCTIKRPYVDLDHFPLSVGYHMIHAYVLQAIC